MSRNSLQINIKDNHIQISLPEDKITLHKQFNFNLFKELFLGKSLVLITIQPQDYSLGYEFPQYEKRTINRQKILITKVVKCDSFAIKEITESEEYWLGLLLTVEDYRQPLDDKYLSFINILDFLEGNFPEKFNDLLLFCSEDGKKINLFNCSFTDEQIQEIYLQGEVI